jgi:heat shock protein HtpX
MSSPDGIPAPVLVYDRIALNRRRTGFLVALAALALAPFVLGTSYALAAAVVVRVSPEARHMRARMRGDESLLQRYRSVGGDRTAEIAALEESLATERVEASRLEAENESLRWKLMPVFVFGMLGSLAVLFWGIASSPTARLLVQAGAQPAGEKDEDARRLLENLAIGAGLPAPKLYVIESSAPNAFAAGMEPGHAVVAVTRGALALFDRHELEGVFAHELSHIGNHDIRLNTIVASIALFLRIPYLMFRRELAEKSHSRLRGSTGLWRLALTPFGIYVFFVAPLVAAVIRAAVSREREYLADADAALLTRYPEGLVRALAKIGGAGAALSRSNPAFSHFYFANPIEGGGAGFIGNLMDTHPPIAQRIERLVSYQDDTALSGLQEAVQAGRDYTRGRPSVQIDESLEAPVQDELAALNQGNVMGRVYRVVAAEPVTVFENHSTNSFRVATVQPGALLVAFDDPGPMRQVNTADQTFGYIRNSVELVPVDDLIPNEVYDPRLRARAEARLAPLLAVAPLQAKNQAVTPRQFAIAIGFGVVVFAGMLWVMVQFNPQ